MRRMKDRLTYANVMATLALFIALGGSSYAAVKLSGSNIKPRSIPASKIKKNSLGGTEIRESKVAKVPAAARADSSAAADTAGDAQKLGGQEPAAFKLSCPAGTSPAGGQCLETSLRAELPMWAASEDCVAAGRHLATFAELEGARRNGFPGLGNGNNYELSGTYYQDTTGEHVVAVDASGNRLQGDYLTFAKPFRCAALPTNTG
jgi:hypothetical protein